MSTRPIVYLPRASGGRILRRVNKDSHDTVEIEGNAADAPEFCCYDCGATLVRGMHRFTLRDADAIRCSRCGAFNGPPKDSAP